MSFAEAIWRGPSIALAALGLAYAKHGGDYVAIEDRSMPLAAVALAAYGFVVCQSLKVQIAQRSGRRLLLWQCGSRSPSA
ncbi:hypothetical protein [Bradyrhizobium elkanii]|uniref:hypothetical protein n=1 Tax=Bradyrhizobium elkanii TaxID=29448 RepID=UPI001FEF8196|nr:hypothetical protein [Bradyrhizobium elkanii]